MEQHRHICEHRPHSKEDQKGCFFGSSMREFTILPDESQAVVAQSRAGLKRLLVRNVQHKDLNRTPSQSRRWYWSFFSGLCIEHNLRSARIPRPVRLRVL